MFWFQRTFTGRIYSVQFNQNRFISFKELQKEQPKKSHQKYGRQWPTGTKPKKGKRRKEICKWQLHLNKAQYPQLAFQKTTPQMVNRLWAACFWKIRKEVVLRRLRKHADWKEAPTTEAKKKKRKRRNETKAEAIYPSSLSVDGELNGWKMLTARRRMNIISFLCVEEWFLSFPFASNFVWAAYLANGRRAIVRFKTQIQKEILLSDYNICTSARAILWIEPQQVHVLTSLPFSVE